MPIQRHAACVLLLTLALLFLCAGANSQDLSNEIVVSFPPTTVRVEFADLAKLRGITEYSALREQYRGAQLSTFENLLSRLGIQESEIEQIVLAWQPIGMDSSGSSGAAHSSNVDTDADGGWLRNKWPFSLDGFASGRFDLKAIARHAKDAGISLRSENGFRLYCLPPGTSNCVVFLTDRLGVFGNRSSVMAIVQARNGLAENLISSPGLLKLLQDTPARAAIWGVATGPGMVDWFQGWAPARESFNMDWSHALKGVESLRYTVIADQNMQLDVSLDCTTTEAAATLKLAFQGLKFLQQYAWQQHNPNRLNPLQSLAVETDSKRLSLKLATPFNTIEDSNLFQLAPPTK